MHRSLSQNHTHTWERPAPPSLPAQQQTSIRDSLVNQKEKVVSWSLPHHTHLEHSCLLFGFLPFLSLSCVPQLRVEMASSLLTSTPPVLQSSFVHSRLFIHWWIHSTWSQVPAQLRASVSWELTEEGLQVNGLQNRKAAHRVPLVLTRIFASSIPCAWRTEEPVGSRWEGARLLHQGEVLRFPTFPRCATGKMASVQRHSKGPCRVCLKSHDYWNSTMLQGKGARH